LVLCFTVDGEYFDARQQNVRKDEFNERR